MCLQVEEGAEEADLASPRASEATASLAGGSGADLASMAGAGPGAAANGEAGTHLRRRSSGGPSAADQLLGGKHTARAARALRHHIKTAARRAPQYAAEGGSVSLACPSSCGLCVATLVCPPPHPHPCWPLHSQAAPAACGSHQGMHPASHPQRRAGTCPNQHVCGTAWRLNSLCL